MSKVKTDIRAEYSKDCTVPIACFSCGNVIAHLYGKYLKLLENKYNKNPTLNDNSLIFMNSNNRDIIIALELEERYCCFQNLMSHPKNLNNNL